MSLSPEVLALPLCNVMERVDLKLPLLKRLTWSRDIFVSFLFQKIKKIIKICGTPPKYFQFMSEPCHEKTGLLPVQKHRRRSAVQLVTTRLCFHYTPLFSLHR